MKKQSPPSKGKKQVKPTESKAAGKKATLPKHTYGAKVSVKNKDSRMGGSYR